MTAGYGPGYGQGYGPGYAAMPAPQPAGKKGFDILGLIAVIIAMIGLMPTLFVFLIGLIPEMNAIWWLLVALIPMLGIGGAVLLFYASLLLIVESRLALASVNAEMNFVLRLSQHHAPADLIQRRSISRRLFRRAKT